jgi:hypothetical protein
MTELGPGGGPSPHPLGDMASMTGMADFPSVAGFAAPPTHRCADTPALILRALEGMPDPAVIDVVRSSLSPCPPCVDAFEVEIRFKIVMAQAATEKAPRSLQLRISETLQRVDLGEIDVTDL